jgi:hypothetical protein
MTRFVFVPHLPDLIQPTEYAEDPAGQRVRIHIRVTEDGRVEILGDAMRPLPLEQLLEILGPDFIEQMLCG